MAASRSTVSFNELNWKKLREIKNKSKIVNIALKFYFDSKALLKQREEEFIIKELEHYENSGEAYSFDETFN